MRMSRSVNLSDAHCEHASSVVTIDNAENVSGKVVVKNFNITDNYRKMFSNIVLAALYSLPICSGLYAQVYKHNTLEPMASVEKTTFSKYGVDLCDNYAWMEYSRSNGVSTTERLHAHLALERANANKELGAIQEQSNSIFKRLVSRKKVDTGLQTQMTFGDYSYFNNRQTGSKHDTYYCKNIKNNKEVIIINGNDYSSEYLSIGANLQKDLNQLPYVISPDRTHVAFGLDLVGDEKYQLNVKNLKTGVVCAYDVGPVCTMQWKDSTTLLYTIENKSKVNTMLYSINITDGQTELLYNVPSEDKLAEIFLTASNGGDYLFLNVCRGNIGDGNSEVYAISTKEKFNMRLLLPKSSDRVYDAAYAGKDLFFVRVIDSASIDGKIMSVRLSNASGVASGNIINEVLPHKSGDQIVSIDAINGFLVALRRRDAVINPSIYDIEKNKWYDLHIDKRPSYMQIGGGMNDFNAHTYRFTHESLLFPKGLVHVNLRTMQTHVNRQKYLDYNANNYCNKLLWAHSSDGKLIPINVLYSAKLDIKKPHKLVLRVYGNYGMSDSQAKFDPKYSILADMGYIYAYAWVRGDGILGKSWADGGSMLNKHNAASDLIDCVKYLKRRNIVANGGVGLICSSAGGYTVASALNIDQNFCDAVVMTSPYIPSVKHMFDLSLPMVELDYSEFGDPNRKDVFDYIVNHAPYDNIVGTNFPNLFLSVYEKDSRVPFWMGVKYAAKLRAFAPSSCNTIVVNCSDSGGHKGGSGDRKQFEQAQEFAWICSKLR